MHGLPGIWTSTLLLTRRAFYLCRPGVCRSNFSAIISFKTYVCAAMQLNEMQCHMYQSASRLVHMTLNLQFAWRMSRIRFLGGTQKKKGSVFGFYGVDLKKKNLTPNKVQPLSSQWPASLSYIGFPCITKWIQSLENFSQQLFAQFRTPLIQ